MYVLFLDKEIICIVQRIFIVNLLYSFYTSSQL